MQKHNGIISLWKFLYSMLIVIFHGYIFAKNDSEILFIAGSIAVEFFFLVSGYLLAKKTLSNKTLPSKLGEETIAYIFKKIKVFFPYILIFYFINVIVVTHYEHLTFGQVALSIWDLLFLGVAGFVKTDMNGPVWYISALLISELFLYPQLRKYKYNYALIAAPLISILLGGYLSHEFISLKHPLLWIGFGMKGLLRGFFEMNVGIILYTIAEKMKNINFSKFGKVFLTLIEIICLSLPLFVSHFVESSTQYDFLMILVISIGITIAFSEKTYDFKILCNKFIYFLERLSLPIYISHAFILEILLYSSHFTNFGYYSKLLILVISTLIIAYITMLIVDYLKEKKIISKTMRKLFIVENDL